MAKKDSARKSPTVRERTAGNDGRKPRRLRQTAGRIAKPLKTAVHIGRKEYYLPLPDTRLGRFLNKRRSMVPRYFKESWAELRQVTWPTRKETVKLTLAVFVFAFVFGVLIAITDYGLEKIFKRLLLE